MSNQLNPNPNPNPNPTESRPECGSGAEGAAVSCPVCGSTRVAVLLFLGVSPDGYVCGECRTWFADGKALATVIGG